MKQNHNLLIIPAWQQILATLATHRIYSQQHLSNLLNITYTHISNLINQLNHHNYLTAEKHGRRIDLRLTIKGYRIANGILPEYEKLHKRTTITTHRQ